ncbi:MAG: SDR family oxidoreductase [Anaerolineae bacterium]|nr:SDR family oxidoreductase [Anaerolineae bacterium]
MSPLSFPSTFPPQHQERQPGVEAVMQPRPVFVLPEYRGSGKLRDRVALITGGDSGIGRAVAVHFAREGADVSIIYLNEHEDAGETCRLVQEEGQRCVAIAGDIGDEAFCQRAVQETVQQLGRLDILVNNAAEHRVTPTLEGVGAQQLERTFRTNIYSFFFMTKAALPHLRPGSAIINTASVVAYTGNHYLIDYTATKGAIVSFTRALARGLVGRGIRANVVAPGPVWTPLIPSTYAPEEVVHFGQHTPLGRAAQPAEIAPSFVFLASEIDSSYITGQVLHVNGGALTCS